MAVLDCDVEPQGVGEAEREPVMVGLLDQGAVLDSEAEAHTEADRLGVSVEDSHALAVLRKEADAVGEGVRVATPLTVAPPRSEGEPDEDSEGVGEGQGEGVPTGVPVAATEEDTEAVTVLLIVFAAEGVAPAELVCVCVPEPQEEGLTDTDGEKAAVPVFSAEGDAEGLPLAVAFALPEEPLEVEWEAVCVWLTEPEWEAEPEGEPGPLLPETDTVPVALPGGADRVTVAEVHTERVPVGQEDGDAGKEKEKVGEPVVLPLTVSEALTEPDSDGEAQCVEVTVEDTVGGAVREVVGVAEVDADTEGLGDTECEPPTDRDTEGEGDTVLEARGEADWLGEIVPVMEAGPVGEPEGVRAGVRELDTVGDTEVDRVPVVQTEGDGETLAD